MLSEPYMIGIEGIFDEEERGDFLFRIGLLGMYILFVCFLATNTVLSMLAGQYAIGVLFSMVFVLAGRVLVFRAYAGCTHGWAETKLPPSSIILFLCALPPLWIEGMEAFFLIRSDVSVSNVFLVALDVVALLPLAILTIGMVGAALLAFSQSVLLSTAIMLFEYEMPETCIDHLRVRMGRAFGRFFPVEIEEQAWWSGAKFSRRPFYFRPRDWRPERRLSYP